MLRELGYYIAHDKISVIRNTLLHAVSDQDIAVDPVSVGVAMAHIEQQALRSIPEYVYLSDGALNKIYETVIGEPLKPLTAQDIRRTKGVLRHFSANPEVDHEAIVNALSKVQENLSAGKIQPTTIPSERPTKMRTTGNIPVNVLQTIKNIARSPNAATVSFGAIGLVSEGLGTTLPITWGGSASEITQRIVTNTALNLIFPLGARFFAKNKPTNPNNQQTK